VKLATTLLDVEENVVQTALSQELAEGEVVADVIDDRPGVFLRGFYIAERVLALAKGSPAQNFSARAC